MGLNGWDRAIRRAVRTSLAGILPVGFLLLGAAGSMALAEMALLHPAKDSTLFEHASGSLASGSGPAVFAGRVNAASQSLRRGLVLFDIASVVPPGSTITGARLSLTLSSTSAGPVTVRLHRVLADWGEGASSSAGGGGAPAQPGDSTWLHRLYDQVFWTSPGGDFDPLPGAEALIDQPALYTWGPTPGMTADVQFWLDHEETNFGWILVGDESRPQTVKRFDSRESSEPPNRPMLEVDYIPPCVPDPLGPGAWRRHCGTREVPAPVLACGDAVLQELGLPEVDPCSALLSARPRDCQGRAEEKLSVLVLNYCAGRLQSSCPVAPEEAGCESAFVSDLLREIARLILEGDCRRASGCAGVLP